MKFSNLIFANLFRKKLRLLLTVGSFAVALFLFAFSPWYAARLIVRGYRRCRTVSSSSIASPSSASPLAYRDKILRMPGVKAVTHNNWFGGVYQDEKNFFPAVRDRC